MVVNPKSLFVMNEAALPLDVVVKIPPSFWIASSTIALLVKK